MLKFVTKTKIFTKNKISPKSNKFFFLKTSTPIKYELSFFDKKRYYSNKLTKEDMDEQLDKTLHIKNYNQKIKSIDLNTDYIHFLLSLGWMAEKEKNSKLFYLRKRDEGVNMTIILDLNSDQTKLEEDNEGERFVNARLLLQPDDQDGILFRFGVNKFGEIILHSVKKIKPNYVAYPDDPNELSQLKKKYFGMVVAENNEITRQFLGDYLVEKYIDTNLGNLIYRCFQTECIIEFKESLVYFKKYMENHPI
eukprot:TRINITY_DN8974_c0_g1_i1.p1 TRINITY_DN8974_c0_g1~~TRINITY_DN8974_c0_g1_i1.p1  ORF type:complete len:251 (-),score=63.08 TRINITY_DN8974_c0_g1_i1:42-794(-)